MAKIKNMGHATVKFNEGVIISGSAGSDNKALVVTGSMVLSGSESKPAMDIYANVSGQYVAIIDNDNGSSGHVLKLSTDGNGSGSRILEMEDGDGDIVFRARADGRFGFGPDGVSSMGAGTFVVGIDNSSHTSDIAISKRLQHLGDSDTYIDFEPDTITLAAGGRNFIKIEEASTDKITINNGGLDIDLKVCGENQANLIRTDAEFDSIYFGGNGGAGNDNNFWVSGSLNSKGTTNRGTAVFSGDLVVSGTLYSERARRVNTEVVSSYPHNVTEANYIILSTGTASPVRKILLPAISGQQGRIIIVKDAGGNAGSNGLEIDADGSETIDGAADKLINSNYGSLTLVCGVSEWHVIASS